MIGGDMNCCLTPKDERGGRPTEQKKQLIDSVLRVMKKYFNLSELGRKLHPNESLFSWYHLLSTVQRRLDYWLVSKHLPPQVKEWNIISVSFSDHSAVSFNIQSDNFIKRGPGLFISIRSLMISASWRG